jgi:two-component system LytT family response regulator
MKILLIDAFAAILVETLQKVAPNVEIVGIYIQGKPGLEAALSLRPDAVFLNLDLPDTSGLGILEHLTAIPVEVIASSEWGTFASDAQRMGAAAYLIQPIDERELKASIKTVEARIERNRPRNPPFPI